MYIYIYIVSTPNCKLHVSMDCGFVTTLLSTPTSEVYGIQIFWMSPKDKVNLLFEETVVCSASSKMFICNEKILILCVSFCCKIIFKLPIEIGSEGLLEKHHNLSQFCAAIFFFFFSCLENTLNRCHSPVHVLVNLSQDPPHKPNKSPKVNSSPPWVSSLSQDWEWRKVYIAKHMMRVAHRKEKLGSQKRSEKAMAPHSSTLAWKIPWMEEPGRLQSMGSLGVGHDWVTSLSLFTFMHWRRKWQTTPVFLPGESQGQGSLVGCRLWGRAESDTTEVT